jgi:hypothetical protein
MKIVIDKTHNLVSLSELEEGDAFLFQGTRELAIVLNPVSKLYQIDVHDDTQVSIISFSSLGPFYHQYSKDTKVTKLGKIRVVAD